MQTAEKTPGPTQQSGIYGHRCGGWNPHPICERGTGWPASGIPPLWGLCLWRPCLGVQPAETAEAKGGFTTAHLHSKTAARQGLKRGLEALMGSPS